MEPQRYTEEEKSIIKKMYGTMDIEDSDIAIKEFNKYAKYFWKREAGYYWVRHYTHGWMVCKWSINIINPEESGWLYPGCEGTYLDFCFEEIDERKIIRKN